MKLAALQCAFSDDVAANVARVTDMVREAAGRGAQVILPPELFEGPYFCQREREDDFRRARPAAGHPTLAHFRALAAELGVVLPISFYEADGPRFYNSVATIDADGAMLGLYRKAHLPTGPGYQEKFYFRPGNTLFDAFTTRYGRIGVAICWDQWFPECARAMALAGADVLLYPTAIGSEPEEPHNDTRDPWQRVMVGHAVANAVAVVAANRIGVEDAITFYGSSFVCDHRGDKLDELSRTEPGIAFATVDVARMQAARASMGFFRDRRPELYHPLTED